MWRVKSLHFGVLYHRQDGPEVLANTPIEGADPLESHQTSVVDR